MPLWNGTMVEEVEDKYLVSGKNSIVGPVAKALNASSLTSNDILMDMLSQRQ